MIYRKLGNTEIEVSIIGLGTMTWGQQNNRCEAFEQMDFALSKGVNLFDAAEMYPVPPMEETQGDTERFIGDWIAQTGRRSEIILATKVAGRSNDMRYIRGGPRLDADQIRSAVEGSLTRLKTDYIDLYQVHWPERATNFFGRRGYVHIEKDDSISIQETLSALHDLVDEGLIRNIGISNETPWGLNKYLRESENGALSKVVSIQNVYNLLSRQFEVGLAEISMREGVGLLAYSPLAFGLLTGKYMNEKYPQGSRLSLFKRFSRYGSEECKFATNEYSKIAKQYGLSLTQMSLAFVLSQSFVSSCLIGATSIDQLKENIDAVDVKLSDDAMKQISEIHNKYPDPAP